MSCKKCETEWRLCECELKALIKAAEVKVVKDFLVHLAKNLKKAEVPE